VFWRRVEAAPIKFTASRFELQVMALQGLST
jgi:hypothetical protein